MDLGAGDRAALQRHALAVHRVLPGRRQASRDTAWDARLVLGGAVAARPGDERVRPCRRARSSTPRSTRRRLTAAASSSRSPPTHYSYAWAKPILVRGAGGAVVERRSSQAGDRTSAFWRYVYPEVPGAPQPPNAGAHLFTTTRACRIDRTSRGSSDSGRAIDGPQTAPDRCSSRSGVPGSVVYARSSGLPIRLATRLRVCRVGATRRSRRRCSTSVPADRAASTRRRSGRLAGDRTAPLRSPPTFRSAVSTARCAGRLERRSGVPAGARARAEVPGITRRPSRLPAASALGTTETAELSPITAPSGAAPQQDHIEERTQPLVADVAGGPSGDRQAVIAGHG